MLFKMKKFPHFPISCSQIVHSGFIYQAILSLLLESKSLFLFDLDEQIDGWAPSPSSRSSLSFFYSSRWFTYVASIELIEQLLGSDRATSRRYVSLLIVCRLLPNFFLIPFGGILADSRDRRRSMIILDLIGAIAPILFLVASYFRSIGMVYAITLLQASVASFYEPCRSSILPLMVKEDEHMRMATTLTGMAWSVMTSVGAGLGGLVVAQYGMTSCFMLDSVSFIISAILILMIGGEWDVSGEEKDEEQTVWKQIEEMSVNGLKYIFNSKFWPLVFLKMTTR